MKDEKGGQILSAAVRFPNLQDCLVALFDFVFFRDGDAFSLTAVSIFIRKRERDGKRKTA